MKSMADKSQTTNSMPVSSSAVPAIDDRTILDIHGEPALAGMRAIHWGEDEPDRVFIGTIGECIVKVGTKVIEHGLVFVYDDPPASSDEREYVPLNW